METVRRYWRVWVVGGVLIGIAAIVGVVLYNVLKNAEANVLVAPKNAVVKIADKEYTNGSYKFFPKDDVTVEVSAEGYESQTLKIDLKSHETALVRAVLTDKDGGYNAYLKNEDNYELMKMLMPAVGTAAMDEIVAKVNEALKINTILPVNTTTSEFYRDKHGFIVTMDDGSIIQIMQSGDNCGVIYCLEVYESNGDLDNVKKYIKEQGYDPELYQYRMQDITLYDPEYIDPRYENL